MPAKLSPLSTFLGFELASDNIRAVVVDEDLSLLGHESVEFDSELAEFGTRLGVHNAPGDSYTAPVDMWIKSLDLLLDKLHARFDLSKIKSIGGSAQHALIYVKNPSLIHHHLAAHPNKAHPLHAFLSSATLLASAQSSVLQDASPLLYAQALETALGGPDAMASRTGQSSHLSLPAVQILKFRETQPDAWASTKRIMWSSNFLAALFLGSTDKASLGLPEVTTSGMWNVNSGVWDEGVADMVAQTTGNSSAPFLGGGANRLKEMLGPIEVHGGKNLGSVAPYFVEKYGFDKDAFVVPFTLDHLASYVSVCPTERDSVLSFGPHDVLMTPAPLGSSYLPSSLYTLLPHPAQDPSEPKKYIAMLATRNADAPRALVRDMYTKSWSSFDRLVSVIAPGGSIGLDNKLFSFWILQSENAPFQHVKGVYRFETGVVTNEFRDLRANPRCLLESQLLSFRVRFARMMASPLFSSASNGEAAAKKVHAKPISLLATRLGVRFDPYDASNLPTRLVAIGSVAHFPSVVSLVGDVFNASVFVPSSSTSGGSLSKQEQSPGGITSPPLGGASASRISAALGGAYIARWAWRRSVRPDDKYDSFDAEVKDLLKKKWQYSAMHKSTSTNSTIAASTPIATSSAGMPSPIAAGPGLVAPVVNVIGSSTTPIKRSGLASAAYPLVEDDEEDEENDLRAQQHQMLQQHLRGKGLQQPYPLVGLGIGGNIVPDILSPNSVGGGVSYGRARTPTTSSTNSSNAYTALSIGTTNLTNPTPALSPATSHFHPAPSPVSAVAPLAIVPLPTDDRDAQAGLVKVSDADHDAFMTYAAIVPEYCRLEGMLIKNLV